MNETYIKEYTNISQFPDFSKDYTPDKELISFYKSEIIELQSCVKKCKNVDEKREINKQIKFFKNGINYLEKKYGKDSTLS